MHSCDSGRSIVVFSFTLLLTSIVITECCSRYMVSFQRMPGDTMHLCTVNLRGIRTIKSLTNFEPLWHKQLIDKGPLSISYKLLNKRDITRGLRFLRESLQITDYNLYIFPEM